MKFVASRICLVDAAYAGDIALERFNLEPAQSSLSLHGEHGGAKAFLVLAWRPEGAGAR